METGFSTDQEQFRDVVARFLATRSPPEVVREQMASDAGYDPSVWQQLAGELGLVGTHLPEASGGFGFGPVELGIAMEQMGRYLYCGPFFASAVMAGYAIQNAGSDADRTRLLPAIADGSCLATLVLDDLNGPERVGQRIRQNGAADAPVLDGDAPVVLDAGIAQRLLVMAGEGAGVSLFELSTDAAGVTIEPREGIDSTRKLYRVGFSNASARRVGPAGGAQLDLLWNQMNAALAHEMVGGATALYESTIEYLKLRVQFGRPIGSFQGLKHRCADLLLDLEMARAATYDAARAFGRDAEPGIAVSMAKALAGDAYMNVAKAAIQLRGGIGFTWEEDTHLWFKRAKASEVFLGTPTWHRERLMQHLEQQNSHGAPAND